MNRLANPTGLPNRFFGILFGNVERPAIIPHYS